MEYVAQNANTDLLMIQIQAILYVQHVMSLVQDVEVLHKKIVYHVIMGIILILMLLYTPDLFAKRLKLVIHVGMIIYVHQFV